jgi:Transposase
VEEKAWAGVDVGKGFHWAHVVDVRGTELLSRRVENDESDLLALIDEALSLAGEVAWAVDQPGGGAALLLALLWERGQDVCYVPGLSVDRARDGYRGECKTDRKDARVIADQTRMRGDLGAAPARRRRPRRAAATARPQARLRCRPDPRRHAAQGDAPGALPGPGAGAELQHPGTAGTGGPLPEFRRHPPSGTQARRRLPQEARRHQGGRPGPEGPGGLRGAKHQAARGRRRLRDSRRARR